jgi:uncharacterized repeat protein (TIGR03843 family)
MSTLPEKGLVLCALEKGDIDLQGQFLNGSNYTFMAQLKYEAWHWVIVYKPVRGEQPLWDFPAGSLAKREVAAYLVSEALGWELVPPTIYRHKAPLGPGSIQRYIEHDPEYHFFNFSERDKQRLRPMVVFDLLVNNADRKGSHMLRDENGHLWFIDHGLCFNAEDKLRTVVWDFSGQEIPANLINGLKQFLVKLDSADEFVQELRGFLQPNEIKAMANRARRLLENKHFPYPGGSRRPYPWPPV